MYVSLIHDHHINMYDDGKNPLQLLASCRFPSICVSVIKKEPSIIPNDRLPPEHCSCQLGSIGWVLAWYQLCIFLACFSIHLTHCTGVFMLLDNECNPQCLFDYWEFDKASYQPQQYFLSKVCLQDLLRMKTLTILVMVTQYCKKICLWI